MIHDPIHDDELNRILLKPRFKLRYEEPREQILQAFKDLLEQKKNYPSKMVDHHVVIDVPNGEEHFWSPQLHVEIEEEENYTVVKGILGPKPKIWTMFIFFHFIVAGVFFILFVIFYSQWSLDQDYALSLGLMAAMPVIWVLLYFAGQLGKKFGYKQMVELHDLLISILKKNTLVPEADS